MINEQSIRAFIQLIHGDGVEAGHGNVVIWRVDTKTATFCATVDAAVEAALAAATTTDVYMGACLVAHGVNKGRGKVEDVTCVPGVWADGDLATQYRKKKGGLPETEEQLKSAFDKIGIRPTVHVYSGGGIQAWWKFVEPWYLDSELEHETAVKFSRRWGETLRQVFQSFGWTIDATFDLTRVFRIPGTLNHKFKPPKPIYLESVSRQCNPDDVERLFVDIDTRASGVTYEQPEVAPIHMGVDRIDEERVKLLVENLSFANDPKFRKTWEHQRSDFADQSLSSYDMAIATMAANTGCSDQDIADLILTFRNSHGKSDGEKAKGRRRDYVQRTIARARRETAYTTAMTRLLGAGGDDPYAAIKTGPGVESKAEESSRRREKVLEDLSAFFKREIVQFIQFGRHDPQYQIQFRGQDPITLGGVEVINSQTKMRNVLTSTSIADDELLMDRVFIVPIKPNQWATIAGWMVMVATYEDNPEQTPAGRVALWIEEYLDYRDVVSMGIWTDDNWRWALEHQEPFVRDNTLFVSMSELHRHLTIRMPTVERLKRTELQTVFRDAGWTPQKVSASMPNKDRRLTRRYWAMGLSDLSEEVSGMLGKTREVDVGGP